MNLGIPLSDVSYLNIEKKNATYKKEESLKDTCDGVHIPNNF